MKPLPTAASVDSSRSTPFPGARLALVLLLLINLFNYIVCQGSNRFYALFCSWRSNTAAKERSGKRQNTHKHGLTPSPNDQ